MSYELTLTTVNGEIKSNADEFIAAARPELTKYRYVVTDDNYVAAKADKANLNKIKDQIKEMRLAEERRIKQPLEDIKTKLMAFEKEIQAVSDELKKGIEYIDSKNFKERCKRFSEVWNTICNENGVAFNFDVILLKHEKEWSKKSSKDSDVEKQLTEEYKDLMDGLQIIESLIDDSIDFQLVERQYFDHCDLKKALSDIERIKKIHEERERSEQQAESRPVQVQKPVQTVKVPEQAKTTYECVKTYAWKTKGTKDDHNQLYRMMTQLGIELVGRPEILEE